MGSLGPAHWLVFGVFPLGFLGLFLVLWRSRVRRRGYPGLRAYWYELPRTQEQKMDAIELTIKGAVCCILGHLIPFLLLIGVVPLYYGLRKLAAIQWGLAKMDEESSDSQSL